LEFNYFGLSLECNYKAWSIITNLPERSGSIQNDRCRGCSG